jgi:hypothetical protein
MTAVSILVFFALLKTVPMYFFMYSELPYLLIHHYSRMLFFLKKKKKRKKEKRELINSFHYNQ